MVNLVKKAIALSHCNFTTDVLQLVFVINKSRIQTYHITFEVRSFLVSRRHLDLLLRGLALVGGIVRYCRYYRRVMKIWVMFVRGPPTIASL